MYIVNIQYGPDRINKQFEAQPRLRDITGDPYIKASLGFGDNVRGSVSGVEMGPDAYIPNGALVVIENKANQKAV